MSVPLSLQNVKDIAALGVNGDPCVRFVAHLYKTHGECFYTLLSCPHANLINSLYAYSINQMIRLEK